MGGEILDRVAKQLGIGNDVAHVIGGQDRAHEHADLLHRAGNASGADHIPHTERPEHLQKHPGCKVAEHAAPGSANRHTSAGE